MILILLFLITASWISINAQESIYEHGNKIVNYEDNFKNLIRNWNERNIANAREYTLKDISFVETISNAERYNYYRNYFSSEKPIFSATSGRSGGENGKEYREFTIRPGYIYEEFFDTRKLPDEAKALLSEDDIEKIKEIITKDFNIDTLNLYNYNSYNEQTDTTRTGITRSVANMNLTSIHPISENHIAILEGRKQREDFSLEEKKELILENCLIDKISRQSRFNKVVNMGDVVYKISFEYLLRPYTVFVICSCETKKVVLDSFFSSISVWE